MLDPFSTFGWAWRCSERVLQQAFSGHLCACHPGMSTWLLNCNNLPFYTQLYAKPLNFTPRKVPMRRICAYIYLHIYIFVLFFQNLGIYRKCQETQALSAPAVHWTDVSFFSSPSFLALPPKMFYAGIVALCGHCQQ